MLRRALAPALVVAAFVADLAGGHGVALAFILVAVPAAFCAALDCYGDALDARCGGTRPLLAGCALALLVLSAALRSPAVVGGLPALAVSALAASLLLYGTIAVGALLTARPVEVAVEVPERLVVEERRAA